MARIRTLKPEALQHRKVGRLSDRGLRVWLALLTQADDEGRVVCDPMQLRLWAFGYFPTTGPARIEAAVQEVAASGLIHLYEVDGTRYANFPSWLDHQKIDKPSKSKLPPPPFVESSPNPPREVGEHSSRIGSDRTRTEGSEWRGGDGGGEPAGGRSAPPLEAASLPPVPVNGDGRLAELERLIGLGLGQGLLVRRGFEPSEIAEAWARARRENP